MAREPELAGFFETRALKSGRGPYPIGKGWRTQWCPRCGGAMPCGC